MAWAYTTGRVHIKSDGTPWRPIVHIEDIARAFVAVLAAPRELVHNEAFNVGRPRRTTASATLAEIVREVVPGSQIEYAADGAGTRRCYRRTSARSARLLPDFKPRWNARDGARELYAAYRDVGLALADYEGPRYKRIEHLKRLLRTETPGPVAAVAPPRTAELT